MASPSRTLVVLITGLAILSGGVGCAHPTRGSSHGHPHPTTTSQTVRFDIVGMHCDGCAKGLQSELASAPGVRSARVSLRKRTAVVTFDPSQSPREALVRVIETAGFNGSVKP